jgi:type III secretory pathway component EscV
MLWSSPAWRWGVALFAAMTALVVNLALVLGFSLSGFVALATMLSLANFDFMKERTGFSLQDCKAHSGN